MFAKFLILLGVVGFCKSADDGTALTEKNEMATINFFIKSGCKSGATDSQLDAAQKCFIAASKGTQYYENVMKAVQGGMCEASSKDTPVFTQFCHSIISADDESTQILVECIGKLEGKYPDPEIIAATPECQAFLSK